MLKVNDNDDDDNGKIRSEIRLSAGLLPILPPGKSNSKVISKIRVSTQFLRSRTAPGFTSFVRRTTHLTNTRYVHEHAAPP